MHLGIGAFCRRVRVKAEAQHQVGFVYAVSGHCSLDIAALACPQG